MDHANHHIDSGAYFQKEKNVKKRIAFFDFDGTITTRDTMIELIKFHVGNISFYTGLLALSPFLVAMKLKLISNVAAKERMLAYFFRNMRVDDFEKLCIDFSTTAIPGLLRPQAVATIEEHKRNGVEVVIVSASGRQWVQHWSAKNNLVLISTTLEEKNGKITGKLNGANCHGEEKVRRIKEAFKLDDYKDIFCYGDTSGDRPMLKLATHAYYKPFENS